jgi:ABC-type antimicrobial peptide transport system permease subunit
MYSPEDINDLLAVTEKTVFFTVVGVIDDMKLRDLAEGETAVGSYVFPMALRPSRLVTFAIRTAGEPESLTAGLRNAIAALDPELPLFDVRTLQQRTDASLRNRRAPALLSLAFSVLALLLSAVGLYGVLAYLVSQRRKEIGIRLALGSSARRIFELVLREGLLLVGAGLGLGALGALLLRRGIASQLYGVRPSDPLVLGAVTALLAAVALGACALPARRATRIDPVTALTE